VSDNVLFKKGLQISGRFVLVTVALDDCYLVFDTYEELTQRRLEFKVKISAKTISSDRDIMKLVERLEIRTI
jgi:hypothetical protein